MNFSIWGWTNFLDIMNEVPTPDFSTSLLSIRKKGKGVMYIPNWDDFELTPLFAFHTQGTQTPASKDPAGRQVMV